MHDPYFEATIDEIRGFDLGDDAELLAELLARRDTGDASLDGEDWMLLGVLMHRRGDTRQALSCFSRAASSGHMISQAHYLRAHLLLAAGDVRGAEEALRQVETATARDGLVPPEDTLHARARVSAARGDSIAARALLQRAVATGPSVPGRLVALGRLERQLGDLDAAERTFRSALELEPDAPEIMVELAAVLAGRRSKAEVHALLTRAVELDRRWHGRIREEPRLVGLLADPELPPLLQAPRPLDLGWMDALAAWLAPLREAVPPEPKIEWMDRAASEEVRWRIAGAYDAAGPVGTLHTDATLDHARELMVRYVPIARGPVVRTRDAAGDPILVFLDSHASSPRLLVAPSEHVPPFLWIPIPGTARALSETVGELTVRPALGRLDMTRVARGFLGYRGRLALADLLSGELEHADVAQLERHFTLSPFLEPGSWGSSHDDDPWPDHIPAQPRLMLKLQARQERTNAQRPGRVWSVSRRTRDSRAYLTIEVHQGDIIVGEVRYRPSPHESVIRELNEHFGTAYPLDMPLDAVAALLGFAFDRSDDIEARLDASSDPDEIAGLLQVLSALRHSDRSMTRIHRRYMDHPDPMVRATLCNIFLAYNFESLLEEMSAIEPDPELRGQIEAALDEGIAPPDDDPYRDDPQQGDDDPDEEDEA